MGTLTKADMRARLSRIMDDGGLTFDGMRSAMLDECAEMEAEIAAERHETTIGAVAGRMSRDECKLLLEVSGLNPSEERLTALGSLKTRAARKALLAEWKAPAELPERVERFLGIATAEHPRGSVSVTAAD